MTPGWDSGLPESVPETVHVTVLGPPVIRTHLGDTRPLERKVAFLLAFLALEGEQTRSVLAGLLWPDVTEHAARNNLRQTLYRLRGLTGDILSPGERVRLLPVVTVDVTALELAAFEGRAADVLHFGHDLLPGLEYDDCPDLQDWLLAQRERLRNVRQDAQLTLMRAAEARGDLHAALAAAEGLLLLEPVSEFAYRSVMDLHHRLGDRGAALRAYTRCREVLQRELGVEPMPQTVELARAITRGPDGPEPGGETGPLTVASGSGVSASGGWLEPFVPLVGRSAALREVRAALEAGRRVYLVGPAGSGKTRLALDALGALARAHGTRVRTVTGRPGDDAFPYATLARAVRELRHEHPALPLPGWVDAELARLQPERSPAPPPLVTDEDRLRFSEAVAALYAHAAGAGDTLLFLDDLHFMDTSSWEVWQYVLGHPDIRSGSRAVLAYRPAELPPARLDTLRATARAREASAVTLEPLTDEDVRTLMRHLAPDAPDTFVQDLSRSTGGLPLTLLETLRALREAGVLTRGWPAHLPHLPGLQALMTRRLEALGGDALRLARVAAVAGPAFSAELAADVLGTHPIDLGPPWTELVQARVLSAPGSASPFTHDLLAQAALQALPAPITALLHGRIAAALERRAAQDDPGRLARHWELAGNAERAAHWQLQAAHTYHANGAVPAAADAYRQALRAGLTPAEQVTARRALGVTLTDLDPAQAEHELQQAQTQARTLGLALDLSLGAAALAELRRKQGKLPEGLQAIGDALRTLPDGADPAVRADLWRKCFWLHLRSAQVPDAEAAIGEALRHAPGHTGLQNDRALLLWHTGRAPEAVQVYEALLRTLPPGAPTGFENNLAWTYWTLGRNAEAAELLERVLAAPTSPYDQGLYRANLSTVLTSRGESRRALHELRLARPLLERYPLHLTDVHHRTSTVHYRAGRYQAALMSLEAALPLAREVNDPYRLSFVLASLAATLARRGHTDAALPLALEAQTLAAHTGYPLIDCVAAQALSVVHAHSRGGHEPGGRAERHADAAASVARACGMPEQLAQALLLQAQVTARDRARHALQREALQLGQTHDLPDVTWRAAAALTSTDPSLRSVADAALHRLQDAAPNGWYRP